VIVYEAGSEERDFVEKSLKAGVPQGQIELIMVLAKLTEKKPVDVQNLWMDQHVGIQQVFREIY
jgi:uncharacterized protein with FMN-binding domain